MIWLQESHSSLHGLKTMSLAIQLSGPFLSPLYHGSCKLQLWLPVGSHGYSLFASSLSCFQPFWTHSSSLAQDSAHIMPVGGCLLMYAMCIFSLPTIISPQCLLNKGMLRSLLLHRSFPQNLLGGFTTLGRHVVVSREYQKQLSQKSFLTTHIH